MLDCSKNRQIISRFGRWIGVVDFRIREGVEIEPHLLRESNCRFFEGINLYKLGYLSVLNYSLDCFLGLDCRVLIALNRSHYVGRLMIFRAYNFFIISHIFHQFHFFLYYSLP